MSHESSTRILRSFLEPLDPNSEEYAGTRAHFSSYQLERIDAIRALSDSATVSVEDKSFVVYVVTKLSFLTA